MREREARHNADTAFLWASTLDARRKRILHKARLAAWDEQQRLDAIEYEEAERQIGGSEYLSELSIQQAEKAKHPLAPLGSRHNFQLE